MPPSYLFGGPKVEPKQFYGGLMPVGEMLVSTDLRKRSIRWNQQCYAFVHMCLYGNKNKYQKAFIQYVARACAGPVDEKDFKECFGRTYKQITLDLRLYIEGHAHTYTLYKDKKGGTLIPKPPPVELRDATQAEIGRIKGEVFRLGTHYEESRNALIIPYIRRERDAGLLASLGLLENTEGRSARARKFLEAASREKVMRPRAYVELARLRLNEALAEPKGGNNKLAPSQVVSVLDPLFTARSQPPPMAEVYLAIAEAWSHSAMPPKPAHIDILIEGVRRFPKNVALVCNTAELCMEGGDMDRARALVNLGLRVASDEAGRAQFEMLGRRLPAQPPAASK